MSLAMGSKFVRFISRFNHFGFANQAKRANSKKTSMITNFARYLHLETKTFSSAKIASEYKVKDESVLKVVWEDESQALFPYIYLRDNCQCEQCFESSAKQRIIDTAVIIDPKIKPTTINFNSENQTVLITWPDNHQSTFKCGWLKERQFPETPEEQHENSCSFVPKHIHWDKDFKIPITDFNSLINDDETRFQWLFDLSQYGLTVIKNASTSPNQLLKIAEIVGGFTRKTHYGSLFYVKSKSNPSNLSYSSHKIPLHVDLAYYRYQPGTQLLHCIEQTADEVGGANYFVDGFNIAEKIRKENPDAYDALTKIRLTFRDIGKDDFGEFEKKLERPIIGLDEHGNYNHIAYNNFSRSSFINATFEDVQKLYNAYYVWTNAINDCENQVNHRMEAGDIVAFDNTRLLHARKTFNASTSRLLEGIYIDWDEVYSTLRVLRRKLGLVDTDSNSWH